MKYFMIFFILFTTETQAEVWTCSNSKASVITNTPTVSKEVTCIPFSSLTTPYNTISREKFDKFRAAQDTVRKEINPRMRLKSPPIISSWRAEEIETKKAKLKRTFCAVSGVAKTEHTTPLVIQITRGTLTIDQLQIKTKKDFAESKWKILLDGSCRNPEITILRN